MVGHFLIVSLIVCSENKVSSKRGGIELFIFCQSLAVCFVFLFLFEVFLFALRFIILKQTFIRLKQHSGNQCGIFFCGLHV